MSLICSSNPIFEFHNSLGSLTFQEFIVYFLIFRSLAICTNVSYYRSLLNIWPTKFLFLCLIYKACLIYIVSWGSWNCSAQFLSHYIIAVIKDILRFLVYLSHCLGHQILPHEHDSDPSYKVLMFVHLGWRMCSLILKYTSLCFYYLCIVLALS